jgi:hypothetical protein
LKVASKVRPGESGRDFREHQKCRTPTERKPRKETEGETEEKEENKAANISNEKVFQTPESCADWCAS